MRPERMANDEQGISNDEVAAPELDLSEEEQLVLDLVKDNSPVDLNELKGKAGLSNKKWDTAIKGLRAKEVVTVEKDDTGLWVSLT